MLRLTNAKLKKCNKLRSQFLEFSNKETSEYLKSNILINSIPIQTYVNQFTYQVVEIKCQCFSSGARTGTPKHFTNNLLRLPLAYEKQVSITKSPKKKKIGKEKLTRFTKQINEASNQINIDSLVSSSTSLNNNVGLDKSFESCISFQGNQNEKKTQKREAREYLKALFMSFKFKKAKRDSLKTPFQTKTQSFYNIKYTNPIRFNSISAIKELEDNNVNGNISGNGIGIGSNNASTEIILETNSMFTITLNSCLE